MKAFIWAFSSGPEFIGTLKENQDPLSFVSGRLALPQIALPFVIRISRPSEERCSDMGGVELLPN
ncbi:hypothetical protein D3C76_790970 [compost metagenome]